MVFQYESRVEDWWVTESKVSRHMMEGELE